jgi:F-box and leucine-rich repeat protein 2/20
VRGCPLLESIDISGCPCVSEKTLKSIARYLPGLLHITFSTLISTNGSISDDSIILLAYRCPLLQTIIVEDSQEISDDSLVAIGQRCPQLRTIYVSCTGITDVGITALVEGCTLLESITLCDIDEITNESAMAIARCCPRLLYINLHWLQRLDDSGINALAHGCPLLQSLLLSRCHGVGNGDRFGEYVGMMPNLKEIMFECSEIGDD